MTKTQIMRKAWSLYRATVAEFPETRSRAQFAVCLKAAHEAARAARSARREWDNMDGEAQYTALIRMAWTVKHRAEATGRAADTEWIKCPDDAQTVAADAWPRVAPALTRNIGRERRVNCDTTRHAPRPERLAVCLAHTHAKRYPVSLLPLIMRAALRVRSCPVWILRNRHFVSSLSFASCLLFYRRGPVCTIGRMYKIYD